MSAVFHYGVPAREGQVVASELSSKGINLLRSTVSDAFPTVHVKHSTVNYEIYKSWFPAAAAAGILNKYTYASDAFRFPKNALGTITSFFMRVPTIIWSYTRNKKTSDELITLKDRYNAVETTAFGKPALRAPLRADQARSLAETDPDMTTSSNLETMNLSAFRVYLLLHRIAHTFLSVHQYPLVSEGTNVEDAFFRKGVEIRENDMDRITYNETDATKAYSVFVPKAHGDNQGYRFNTNLPERDLSKVRYTIQSVTDLPNNSVMFFPYVADLARGDKKIVYDTVRQYFYGFLGEDDESASSVFEMLRAGFGSFAETTWGLELSHLYGGIRLAFETGCSLKVLVTPAMAYQGYALIGAGYVLRQHDVTYSPAPFAEATKLYHRASPHAAALTAIFSKIDFDDDMEMNEVKAQCSRMSHVAELLRRHGYSASDADSIQANARHLTFPADEFLPITAHNVSRVFTAMRNGSDEREFPLHHLAILEKDRRKRLLSAFGATVPSFRVTGGRTMSLSGAFEYKVKSNKGKGRESVTTGTIYCAVVPYRVGCEHLELMIQTKEILNPVGTPLASRASSKSLLREFRDKSGLEVLTVLRGLCGVVMESGEHSGSKRIRDGEDEEGVKPKKLKALDF